VNDIVIDQNYLLDVTQNLIRIDTVNHPGKDNDYWPGIRYLQGLMEELDLRVVIEGKEHYPNIIGRLCGNGTSSKTLMYNAHLDTVPIGNPQLWKHDPFGGIYEDGYCYGRGACDMAGQIAMILSVVKYLSANRGQFSGELAVSFVTGHETGSVNGSVWLMKNHPELLKADMCYIPEASNWKFTINSRGILWVKAITKGVSGHTALFNEKLPDGSYSSPVNAIHHMIEFANRARCVDDWMVYQKAEHLGIEDGMYTDKPVFEVNMIQAGEKQNTIPELCTAVFDIRFLPTQTPEGILKELQCLAGKCKQDDPAFDISFEVDMIQSPPMCVDMDSELYRLAARNYEKVFGRTMEKCGCCAPGDAVAFSGVMPVTWLGPTWDNGHGYNERVSIPELTLLAKLYAEMALDYLK